MKYFFTTLALYAIPFSLKAFSLENSNFRGVVYEIVSILDLLTPLLFGAALIVFFWGLSKFVINADNENELNKGKNYMLWGILALFIMISYRAIVVLVVDDLEFGTNRGIQNFLPTGGNVEQVDSNINFQTQP